MPDDKLELASTVGETADTVTGGTTRPSALVEVTRVHYDVGRELARGGMGRILIARDLRIGRTVAVKELLGSGDALIQRFEREALVTGRLQHPAIVPVYEAGRWPSGEPFYAMKLVSGSSLDKVVAEKRTFAERLALLPNVIQICEAMAYAHGERVIHRDLKPHNVLVGKFGETVVVDWGLAKHLDESELPAGPYRSASGELTAAGAVMGTPMYMPPEQADGSVVDERADVYALGAMLYHVLTGGPPYRGASLDSILDQVLSGPPVPLGDEVPGELRAIVGKAMSRDRTARYPSAKELADELVRFQAGQLVTAHAYSAWDLVGRFVRRHRAAVVATTALIVLGGVTAAIAIRQVVAARDAATVALGSVRAERAASLQEQGRRELYAGQPARAAAYLAEAYRSSDNPTLRLELAAAMRAVDASIADVDTHGAVTSFVVARDSDRLVTIVGGKVELWSIDGRRLAELPGARTPIVFAGARLVTAMTEGPLVVWDGSDGHRLVALAGSAFAYDFDVSGERVYGAIETTVRAWSIATGEQLATANVASVPGMSLEVAASTDGKRVIATTPDGFVVLDGKTLVEQNHLKGVEPVAVAASGSRVLVHNGASYALADPENLGAPLASFTLEGDEPRVLDALGDRFLEVPHEGPIRLYTATGTLLASYGEGGASALSVDGKRVAIVDAHGAIRVYNDKGVELARLAGDRHGTAMLAFDGTGERIMVAGADGFKSWRIPAPPWRELAKRAKLDEGAIAPDGKSIVVTDGSTAFVIDASTGAHLQELVATEPLAGAGFSRDGRRIATFSTSHVIVWERGQRLATLATLAIAARFSPDGARILTVGEDDAYVWDAASGRLVATLAGSDEIVTSARFSSDGARIVTAGEDHVARIYDAATGARQVELVGHGDYLVDAMFDANGSSVITASADGTARIWDATTGTQRHVLRGHASPVRSMALSHDGRRLATVAAHEACLWSAATGVLEVVLPGDQLEDVAFTADDRILVTGSATHATLWDRTGMPILDAPPPALPHAGLLGSVDIGAPHAPRHRDPVVAIAPDGQWLLAAGNGLQRLDLAREVRSADAISERVVAASGWRVENGGLVPSRDAEMRSVAVATSSAVFNFEDDIVDEAPRRASVTPPAEAASQYALAWSRETAGDLRGAYTALLAAAAKWPTADDKLRTELFTMGALARVAPEDIIAAVAATPVGRAPHGQLVFVLAAIYEELGEVDAHDKLLTVLVADPTPGYAATARLAQAEHELAAGHPREIAARLVAAIAIVDGSGTPDAGTVLARARDLSLQLASEYRRTWDARYALAARRIYGAYLARARDPHDSEVRAASTALDALIAVGPTTRADVSKELVRRAVRLRRRSIARCYAEALAREPGLAGRVTVRLVIEDGVVRNVDAFGDAKLERLRACIVDELRDLALPHAPGARSLVATYPFLFRRAAP